MGAYDDMLDMEPPRNPMRLPMAMSQRAAQFAPFAALSGFDDAVAEQARETDDDIYLTEDCREQMSRLLTKLLARNPNPRVCLTYFEPDAHKQGGRMRRHVGRIYFVDSLTNELVFTDDTSVRLDAVRDIEPF